MKKIINVLWDLRNKLEGSCYIMKPRYLKIYLWDLFDIDSNIFVQIENINIQ